MHHMLTYKVCFSMINLIMVADVLSFMTHPAKCNWVVSCKIFCYTTVGFIVKNAGTGL